MAVQRAIKLDTAESYLAEAIHAGHAYCWQRLGLAETLLGPVVSALHRLSCGKGDLGGTPGTDSHSETCPAVKEQKSMGKGE